MISQGYKQTLQLTTRIQILVINQLNAQILIL